MMTILIMTVLCIGPHSAGQSPPWVYSVTPTPVPGMGEAPQALPLIKQFPPHTHGKATPNSTCIKSDSYKEDGKDKHRFPGWNLSNLWFCVSWQTPHLLSYSPLFSWKMYLTLVSPAFSRHILWMGKSSEGRKKKNGKMPLNYSSKFSSGLLEQSLKSSPPWEDVSH